MRDHRAQQDAGRIAARQLWHDEGWVFAKPDGKPLNPDTDYHEWKALLREAGLRDGRLHDARHTAATVLALLGVPTPTAMAIMGWSSAAMAARYQHVLDSIRKGVADQVGGLLRDGLDGADDDHGKLRGGPGQRSQSRAHERGEPGLGTQSAPAPSFHHLQHP